MTPVFNGNVPYSVLIRKFSVMIFSSNCPSIQNRVLEKAVVDWN